MTTAAVSVANVLVQRMHMKLFQKIAMGRPAIELMMRSTANGSKQHENSCGDLECQSAATRGRTDDHH